jgi:hypothetical protein
MSVATINHLSAGLEPKDCAICALACYLGTTYTDALRAAHDVDREGAYEGLDTDGIKQAAEALGATLRGSRTFDPETAYGIVKTPDHAAVLRRGLVLDRATVWSWDEWRRQNKGRVILLVAVD